MTPIYPLLVPSFTSVLYPLPIPNNNVMSGEPAFPLSDANALPHLP